MLNYANLSDVEFEYLCQDIMQRKLGISLRRFAAGRDGGIDLADSADRPDIIVQVKHYIKSTPAQLRSALRNELPKVKNYSPSQYYICCAKELTPQNIGAIYSMFSDYMESDRNIITLNEIEDFLQDPQNADILEKHYKLWIESTGVLQNALTGDIFVDCEALLADIQMDEKVFVRTRVFDRALKLLEKDKTLFIVGDPGVGKSMTSKMLILYYAAKNYRVRYTSNNADLSSLKKSLSRDADTKEIILIDDCFGQAYFDLKDSQNNDLLALMKYIYFCKNKLLILNSRVTIFQEARERQRELARSLENNEFGVYILDVSAMDGLEKAKILYNHLYMNGIDAEYFSDIKKDRRYRQIISHPNYNPRIIEFVCNPKRYAAIEAHNYYQFIKDNLDNPSEVWKDEYERRLKPVDRILLLTVFSLSDVAVEESIVKACFEAWIKNDRSIDRTVNQYEASLRRLMDGFLHIVDERGKRKIGVVNPSVNDYLDSRISNDPAERDFLLRNICSIRQFYRLLPRNEFNEFFKSKLGKGEVDSIVFDNAEQKTAFIAYFVAAFQIRNKKFMEPVHSFLKEPHILFINARILASSTAILKSLIVDTLIDYYELERAAAEIDWDWIFEGEELEYIIKTINVLSPLFRGEDRDRFIQCSADAVSDAIDDYCDDVDAYDYDPDIRGAVELSLTKTEYGVGLDREFAGQMIEEDVKEAVEDEICTLISKLPDDIKKAKNFEAGISVYVSGADSLIEAYFGDDRLDDDRYQDDFPDYTTDDIDTIFER